MTTKTDDIKLPPLPEHMQDVAAWLEAHNDAEVARDILNYTRAAVEADRQRRGEPSSLAEVWRINADEAEAYGQSDRADILRECAAEVERLAAPQPAEPETNDAAVSAIQFALETDEGIPFLRCWNEGNFDVIRREWPEAPESVFIGADPMHPETRALLARYSSGQPAASAEPAVWVAADTLNSPHPTCISSLAYMSQIDQARGREYVPLAVITHKAAPVAQEPVASGIEQMALTRYRPAPDGLLRYKVVAGDGTRALYHGTKDECCTIARKLTEAFLDGAFAAQSAAPVAAQAQRGGNGVVDTHCYKIPG